MADRSRTSLPIPDRAVVDATTYDARDPETRFAPIEPLRPRSNHNSFKLVRVSVVDHPDLAERFGVEVVPTLCVVEDRRLRKRIAAPRGCRELERELAPWLH